MQIASGAEAIHNLLHFRLVLGDNREPDVVFMATDIVVGNRRNLIHCGGEFIDIGHLSRTKARNKAEPMRVVDATETPDNSRITEAFDRLKDLLFGDALAYTSPIQDIRKHTVRTLFQREGILYHIENMLFKGSHKKWRCPPARA